MAIAPTSKRLQLTIDRTEYETLQRIKRDPTMTDSQALSAMLFALSQEDARAAARVSGLKLPDADHTNY